ncbi:hypothetical protein QL285_008998 [Trifolium repens]|nr:hypothetical protein QL285_008998 [Trifolium repens]
MHVWICLEFHYLLDWGLRLLPWDRQHAFIPFAFITFGFLASKDVGLLQRIQKVMNINVVSAMNVVFKRIGFAIQKGVAAQLVARLPLNHM